MRVVVYQIEKREKIIYNLGILLDKLCLSDKKIGVLCDKDNINEIDKDLWTFSTNAFIPHGIIVCDKNDQNKNEDNFIWQPVLLSYNIVDIVNRQILCVFNLKNMNKISAMLTEICSEKQENNWKQDVIYITHNDDVDEIKNIFPLAQIDVYKKNNGYWQKSQF